MGDSAPAAQTIWINGLGEYMRIGNSDAVSVKTEGGVSASVGGAGPAETNDEAPPRGYEADAGTNEADIFYDDYDEAKEFGSYGGNMGGNMSPNMGGNMLPNMGGNMGGNLGGNMRGNMGGNMGGNWGSNMGGDMNYNYDQYQSEC